LAPQSVCVAEGLAAVGPAVVAAVRQFGGDRVNPDALLTCSIRCW
jgi:hypothetical protein